MRFRSGSWTLQVRAGAHRDGRARYLTETVRAPNTAQGKRIAEKALAALVAKADRLMATGVDTERTVLDAVEAYIAWGMEFGGRAGTGFTPKTVENRTFERNVLATMPAHANRKLHELRPRHIVALLEDIEREHGIAFARAMRSMLSTAMKHASERDWIDTNPVRDVRQRYHRKPGRLADGILTPEQMVAVLDAVEASDPYVFAAIYVGAVTGARRASITALRWSDIDFDAKTIRVQGAVVRGTGQLIKDEGRWRAPTSGYTYKSTKTGSAPLVAVDDETLTVLRRHKRWTLSRLTHASEWVFPQHSDPSRPVRPDYFTEQWGRLRAALIHGNRVPGLTTKVKFHGLRKFVATQLIGSGVDAVTVAGRLGYANPEVMFRHYTAMLPENDRAAANILGSTLAQAREQRRVG
jgi:integrase